MFENVAMILRTFSSLPGTPSFTPSAWELPVSVTAVPCLFSETASRAVSSTDPPSTADAAVQTFWGSLESGMNS